MSNYMAHGFCLLWEPGLIRLHVISDIITGLAYYAIAIALFYFIYKRRDTPFPLMFLLFSVFILSCGTTHLSAAYTIYVPKYWEEGVIKAITAFVSVVAAILLIPLIPKAISLPSLTKTLDENKNLNGILKKQVEKLILSNTRLNDEIAERRQTENAMKELSYKMELILNSAAEGIYSLDLEGKVTSINPAGVRMLGYEIEEVIGKHCHSTWHHSRPDGTPLLVEECGLNYVLERGTSGSAENTRFWKKDGTSFPVEYASTPMFEADKLVGAVVTFKDITERVEAEAAIRSSEHRYRSLFENMLEGFAYCKMLYEDNRPQDFIYLAVNGAFERLTGLNNVVGRKITEVIPGIKEANPELFEIYGRVVATGKPERFETYSESFGGWLYVSVYSNEKGFFVAVFDNITEHKRADIALRASEEKYRTLIQEINDGVFIMDDRGTFTFVNNALARIHGYEKPDELIGRNFVELSPPEAREALKQEFSRNMQSDQDVGIIDIPIERLDKSKGYIQIHPVRIVENGRLVGVRGIVRDITERNRAEESLKISEEKYRNLVNNAPVGIYKANFAGKFLYVNKALATMFEFDSPEAMMSENLLSRYKNPEDRVHFLDELKKTGKVNNFELDTLSKTGKTIHIILNSTLEDGAISGMVLDVTEQKKLQAQLRHSQKMEAIGTLAGGIAHDFNNILNVIMGYGAMVLDGIKTDSLSKGHMNEVLAAADKAANLTKRLLAFSRKHVVEMKPVNVNELILGTEKMLSRIIGEDIIFTTELTGKKLTVMADAGQIEQVLVNLASNARDAMPKGGRLTISSGIREVDDEYITAYGYGKTGTYALIAVTDTGTGMDAETQKKIFEPFFTTKGIGEGTGLGLSIAYGIIKQHNGYIQVYSEEGKGSTFKIFLPLVQEGAAKGQEPEAVASIKGGTETILVAEDDAALRKLARIVLESFGYTVITAEDGEDAISKYLENREKIQLVILDMLMPKKSGKEASEEIRKISPDVRTLFMSGYTMDMLSKKQLLDEGMDFILKPVSPKDLLEKIRKMLDS